jgi:hypothetical protein
MLQRLLTLILALAFMTTASASHIGAHAIKATLDEFNFAITVEWDQKDQSFYQAQVAKLQRELSDLRDQGVTNAEIIDVAVSTVKDQKLAQEMKAILNVVEVNKLSAEQAQSMVLEAAKKSSAQGASWSGDAWLWIGPIIAVALIIAVFSGGSSSGNSGGTVDPGYTCGYVYSCYWGYDWWGSYRYQCDWVYSCGWYY